ncbi:MAG: outer membrane beta-barrel protein [Vicinamibacterales bacterium]
MRSAIRGVVCAACLSGALPVTALAQSWSGGIKAGVVAGRLAVSGTGAFDTTADAGAIGGGFLGVMLGRSARVQLEVLASERRFSAKGTPVPFDIRSRGLEVPLLLQLGRLSEGRVRPVVFVGPQLTVISSVVQRREGAETDLGDAVADTDVAFTVGGALEVAAGRGALVIDVRATIGTAQLSVTPPPSFTSRAAAVLVGYRF